VSVLGISMDAPDASRALAADFGIRFPLLSDEDGAVSRIYAGVTSDAATLPGVVIVNRDGAIAFRQVATSKDDRMPIGELLATLDRVLGTAGPAAAAPGYAAIDRAQLRVAIGGGGVRGDGAARGTVVGAVSGLIPLGRHLLVGPRLASEPRDAPIDLDLAVIARAPLWARAGAIELGAAGGYTPWGVAGGNASLRAGMWFATSPRWALQLDVAVTVHGLGFDARSTELSAALGVARLFAR
jgi:hypothetical protein